jgi:hypothetical protein
MVPRCFPPPHVTPQAGQLYCTNSAAVIRPHRTHSHPFSCRCFCFCICFSSQLRNIPPPRQPTIRREVRSSILRNSPLHTFRTADTPPRQDVPIRHGVPHRFQGGLDAVEEPVVGEWIGRSGSGSSLLSSWEVDAGGYGELKMGRVGSRCRGAEVRRCGGRRRSCETGIASATVRKAIGAAAGAFIHLTAAAFLQCILITSLTSRRCASPIQR